MSSTLQTPQNQPQQQQEASSSGPVPMATVAAAAVDSAAVSSAVTEKDISYWQRSLEALAQKVIVGEPPVVTPQEEQVAAPMPEKNEAVNVNKEEQLSGQEEAVPSEQHDSNLFRLSCCCGACLGYRETIIQLFVEDFEYNTLWERLQLLIKKFYDFIPEQEDSQLYGRYMELMDKSSLKWLTDGRINTKKNIQISLGSNLPLSNEMTFILVFSMLYTRDPHQLFELLCLQLRSIVKAYSQGLQDLISETSDGELQYSPTELLTYILDGYDKLCHSAKSLSPLLFELQRGHLQQFSLTWCLINKRMYQRFVYLEVQKIIPECILKLKELLFDEEYKSMVYRFIQFDDEMNSTSQIWRDVWSLLHDYHKAKEDSARRKRITSAHSLLVAVRDSEFNFDPEVQRTKDRPIVEWLACEDRSLVWQYVVLSLRSKWIACINPRLTASIENVQCRKCNFALATHYIECSCRTCLIAGGTCLGKSKEQLYCAKCSFFKKLDRDYLDYIGEFFNKPLCEKQRQQLNGLTTCSSSSSTTSSSSSSSSSSSTDIALPESDSASTTPAEKSGSSGPAKDSSSDKSTSVVVASSPSTLADNTSLYHISWAIFKHLPERVAYTWTTLEPKRFCIFQGEPCKINACRVAINIIAMLYPLNLSKFLIKSYHPLKEEERKKMAENWNIDVKNFMQRFCDDINKRWRTEVADRIHPLHFLDLLWESDDSESALLSDMASAFAEWFLIDFQFPQRNVIYQYFTKFFLAKGTDIEFDMKCFEAVSGSRLFNWSTPASPLRQMIADDMQSKLLGVNWSTILPEEALAAINGEEFAAAAKLEGISPGGVLVAATTGGGFGHSPATMAVIEPIVKLCSDDGTICKDCKECFTDTVTKSEIFEKEIKKPLVEALKLAASNKILETELKTLQKEHSMLKDMVRDLEQIHEQKHSTIVTQQCGNSTSSSNNTSSNKSTIITATRNSTDKSGVASSSSNVTANSAQANRSPAVATKTTTTNSPAKSMLNQATNTPSKTTPTTNTTPQPNGKVAPAAVSQQPGRVAATKAIPKAVPATPPATAKVSSKATSTTTAAAAVTAPPTALPANSCANNGTQQSGGVLAAKEDHKKTCHRGANGGEKGDGSCVCYYCTLFGQSVCLECNHNQRTNETRDRLRKKIKQLQSNKDNQQLKSLNLKNIKIPPGGLLKKINTNKSNSTNAVEAMKNSNLKTTPVPAPPATSGLVAAAAAAAKIPLPPALAGKGIPASQQPPVQVAKKPPPPPPVEEPSLDAILRFIEGDDDEDKQSSQKKAAKKVKQKQKKQELKKITELSELSQKFSEFHLEEQKAQKRLQFQQNLKKKDKKQLLEDIKAFEDKKLQLQTDINSLVSSIKNNNPEFNFNIESDPPTSGNGKKAAPVVEQQLPAKLQQNINLLQQQKQRQQQQLIQQHQQGQQQQQSSILVPQDNVSIDPARRMVTIKRTFLPHSEPQVTVTAKGPSPDKDQLLYTFINGQLVPPEQKQASSAAASTPPPPPSSAKQQKKQQKQLNQLQQMEMKMAFNDAKQISDMIVKSQFTNDTDVWITEKLLKLSLREQSAQQQQQSMREVDELMQKLQLQTADGKRKKEDIVSLTSKLSEKLTQIKSKAKNSVSEAQAKAAAQMLQKIVKKLEVLGDGGGSGTGEEAKGKKKKSKKKDKESDEIDALVSWCEGLDINGSAPTTTGSKKGSEKKAAEKSVAGKVLNRKLSKDSISSSGSGAQKGKEKVKEKEKEKKPEESKVVVVKKKVVRKKSDAFIDPEFDNNAFKLLNLDDTESGDEEEEIEEVGEDESAVSEEVKVPSRPATPPPPSSPKVVEIVRPPTPPSPVPVMVATSKKSKKKADKAKETTPPVEPVAKSDGKQVKNKENLAPPPASTQKTAPVPKNGQPTSHNGSRKGSVAPPPEKSILDNPNLSKRQKKLMLKQQQQQEQPAKVAQTNGQKKPQQQQQHAQPPAGRHIDKTVKNADRLVKSSNDRRSKVNISADTTLELLNESGGRSVATPPKIPNTFPPGDTSFGASIMDQLSRGIRVEGLQLPPGITLTRVDAIQAEAIKAKRESIKKICEPMPPPQPEVQPPPAMMMGGGGPFMMSPMMGQQQSTMISQAPGQDAVIMVDTNKLKGSGSATAQNGQDGDKKSSKKSKRKNKNKSKNDSSNKSAGPPKSDAGKNQKPGNNIVTLRNPMFQGGAPARSAPPPGGVDPSAVGQKPTGGYDQPATIFKNDNGMFTIRNPALHQALSGGAPPSTSGFRPFNTNYLVENGIFPTQGGVATSGTPAAYLQQHQQVASDRGMLGDGGASALNSTPFSATVEPPRKCNSAIGSEMKNAQKQKQQQAQQQHHQAHHLPHPGAWQNMNGGSASAGTNDLFNPLALSGSAATNQRCYSPFESLQYGLTGSQDYMNPQSSAPGYFPMSSPSATVSAIGSERSQARAQAAAAMSSVGSSHCCDDSPSGSFYDGLGAGGANHKYDDLSFLHNLQPGQRLNSEVTIHNINESKFLRQQQQQLQGQSLSNDIEITRIPAPGSSAAPVVFNHPLLMSPAGSNISSETASVSGGVGAVAGGAIGGSSGHSITSAGQANLLALNDMETSLFLQKYQQQQNLLQQRLQQQMEQLQLQPISRQQQQLIGEYGGQ
ncbi:hypothetical protein pipiens_016099 [Culex pipiens pipiens]|uniref:Uncharacterized protein n=1 Tax=Culex pipiens pipiens TaxID=38569 RepID=A0ABD1CMQ5_CULPP